MIVQANIKEAPRRRQLRGIEDPESLIFGDGLTVTPPRLMTGGVLQWISEHPGMTLLLFALAIYWVSRENSEPRDRRGRE